MTQQRGRSNTSLFGIEMKFSVGVLAAIVFYWFITMIFRSAPIDTYFFSDHGDTSMDYFNVLANLRFADPWCENSNYPALCYLFLKVMYHFLPQTDYGDGFFLRSGMIGQLGYMLFLGICLVMILETVRYMTKGTSTEKTFFCCALLFSGPMFFLLERGNLLIAVLAFSLLFLALYDSDKLSYRLVAYVCLALAAAIKIYPAVLGLLILGKKRYKEAIGVAIFGAAVFLAPFFVFDGLNTLKKMLVGIGAATAAQTGIGLGCNYCINNLIQMIGAFCGKNIVSVPGWVSVASALFCLCLFVLSKQEWQKIYSLVLLCIWFPTFSYTYTLVLLFLPIISFLYRSKGQRGRFEKINAVMFGLMIIPYALPMVDRVNNVLGVDYVKYLK